MADEQSPSAIGAELHKLREELAAMKARTSRSLFWDGLSKVVASLVVAGAVWVFGIEGRVAHLESTGAKAIDVERLAGALRSEILALHSGPEWLRKEMQGVSVKLDGVRDDISKVKERLASVEQQVRR